MSESKDIKKWVLRIPEKLKEQKEEPKVDEKGKPVLGADKLPVMETKMVDVDCPIKGSVKIKLLSARERALLSKEIRYRVNKDGDLVKKSDEEITESFLKAAEDCIESIDLVRKDDEYKYASLEEVMLDEDGTKIMSWVATKVVQGVRLGKDCVPA